MGLDAYVPCNCLREGKTTEPPVNRAKLYFDEEGFLEMHYPLLMRKTKRYQVANIIDIWRESCCQHPNMHYCNEHVGNWSAVRFFQQVVQRHTERFPSLATIIPATNDGKIDASKAPELLRELDVFCRNVTQFSGIVLLDSKTRETLYHHVEAHEGFICLEGPTGFTTRFDQNGLFVQNNETEREVFRSTHCTQTALPNELATSQDGRQYTITPSLLTDVISGRECRINFLIGNDATINEIEITTRNYNEDDFFAIKPLKSLLNASIEIQNPIYWC